MRVLFDSSVLVAAMVEAHPAHSRAFPWLKRAREAEIQFLVAAHSLAEVYAVLTALPLKPKITPGTARRFVEENVEAAGRVVPLNLSDYRAVLKRVVDLGLTGGVIYDALIARAAEKSKIDRLLTLNPAHFHRVWPEGAALIGEP